MMISPNNNIPEVDTEDGAQPLTTPLTSFTELLGLDSEAGQVCGPDGYCE